MHITALLEVMISGLRKVQERYLFGVMKRKYQLSTLEQAAKRLDAQLQKYTHGLIKIVKNLF